MVIFVQGIPPVVTREQEESGGKGDGMGRFTEKSLLDVMWINRKVSYKASQYFFKWWISDIFWVPGVLFNVLQTSAQVHSSSFLSTHLQHMPGTCQCQVWQEAHLKVTQLGMHGLQAPVSVRKPACLLTSCARERNEPVRANEWCSPLWLKHCPSIQQWKLGGEIHIQELTWINGKSYSEVHKAKASFPSAGRAAHLVRRSKQQVSCCLLRLCIVRGRTSTSSNPSSKERVGLWGRPSQFWRAFLV